MSKITALTKDTYNNMQYDAGVLYKNLSISTAKTVAELLIILKAAKPENIIGVTRGGIEVKSEAEWRETEFDDSPSGFVGSSEKGNPKVTISTTILEATAENVKMAMGTADIKVVNTIDVVQERDHIDLLKDYMSKVILVARKGKDKLVVLEFDNVISVGGYSEKTNSKGETELPIVLQATKADMVSAGDLPYRKLYFK